VKALNLTKEYLYQRYVVEGLSIRQIARLDGISELSIRKWMKIQGIPARSKSEALSGPRNPMFGKPKSEEARKRTSETLRETNLKPEVKARRSVAVSGSRNPMFGRTHSEEVKAAAGVRLKAITQTETWRAANREAMARPEVRQALSEAGSKKVGPLNPFFGRTHSSEAKQRISQANRGRFQGPNGSNWQGGKTSLALLIRNTERSVTWRKAVFNRDKFTCQECGRVGGPLHADHIKPFAVLLVEYNIRTLEDAYGCEAMWDISNGRTLCVPCHKQTPSFAGNFQKNYKLV